MFLESCTTYSNEAKIARLGVSPGTLRKYGAVSIQTAREMAEGIRKTSGADIGCAVTGIAGWRRYGSKPAGLVFMAISDSKGTEVKEFRLGGDRLRIKQGSAMRLLNWLRLFLLERAAE